MPVLITEETTMVSVTVYSLKVLNLRLIPYMNFEIY